MDKTIRYVALLRGINVGGKNIIPMKDLKKAFEEMGFEEVTTYIQSGNVLFSSEEQNIRLLSSWIGKKLSSYFSYNAKLLILDEVRMNDIIRETPKGFGKEPGKFRYDVAFIMDPLSASEAIRHIQTKPGVDTAAAGQYALYFTRLIAKAGQSRLSKIASLPIYQDMTIRNWNTTTRLHEMMES